MINNLIKHNKEDIQNFLSKKIFKKIFIIAGNNSFKLSGLDNFFLETLKEKKTKYFLKKNPYPEYEELLSLISEIKNFSPDLIVACGGGSVLDYGKIANVLENKESLDELTNSIKERGLIQPIVVRPDKTSDGKFITRKHTKKVLVGSY